MKHKCTGWAIVTTMERPDGTWYDETITEIDDDWVNWEEEKLFEEIAKLAWQPFEYWEGEEIHKEINKLASSVREKIKKETNE